MKESYKIVPTDDCEYRGYAREKPRFKYFHVWQSARVKLRFRHIVNSIIRAAVDETKDQQGDLRRLNAQPALFTDTTLINKIAKLIVLPKSRFLFYWNILIFFTLIYTAILMPYFLAFPPPGNPSAIDDMDIILSAVYFLDFLISCSTAFYTNSGHLVTSRRKILFHYLKSWMIIDFIAFFPFELLFSDIHGVNPLFKLARIARLYNIVKITKLIKWIQTKNNYGLMIKLQDLLGIRHSVLQILITFFTILICIHIISCIWCFSARLEDFSPNTWVYRSGIIDYGDSSMYITSIYWAFTTLTTVGYGDVSAGTTQEYIISIFWMICSLNILGFTISTLSSHLNSIDTREKKLMNKLAIIDEFCAEVGLGTELRLKLRNALRASSAISRCSLAEQVNIFEELPKDLKFEVALVMHRGAARTIKYFRSKEDYLVIAIVPYLRPNFVNMDCLVYRAKEFADDIYFVVEGRVVYVSDGNYLGIYTVVKKDYFGDIEVMMKIPRKYSAICRRNCELLCLSYHIVNRLKKDYPNIYFELRGVAIERDRVLKSTLCSVKNLRDRENPQSDAKFSRDRFQTFHRARREMKKTEIIKKITKHSIEIKPKIHEKLSKIQEKLDSLQQSLESITRTLSK